MSYNVDLLLSRYDREVDQATETIREALESAETSEECKRILKHATSGSHNNGAMAKEIVAKMTSFKKII